MRTLPSVLVLSALSLLTTNGLAQGRGRGRAEEIQNRVGAFFTDTAAPAAEGDKIPDLASCELVKAAAAAGQMTVLYVVDMNDDADVRDQFERTLFGSDELGIELRCFHCGRIDLGKSAPLKARYGKQAPLLVVFDKNGKEVESLPMAGYKPSTSSLGKALEKAAQGAMKPSLDAFAKEYGGLVRDLEQALAKKKAAQEKQAKAGGDKAKKADADKDLEVATAAVDKLLEKEKAQLEKAHLPVRPDTAVRLGGRGMGPGGGGGGGGSGGGRPGG